MIYKLVKQKNYLKQLLEKNKNNMTSFIIIMHKKKPSNFTNNI